MIAQRSFAGWYRHRLVWVAVILLATLAGTVVLVNRAGPEAEPADVHAQVMTRMRATLEQADPGQHNHAGHGGQQAATGKEKPAVICGVRVYGYEPAEVTTLADVRTVYGFHLCGVAEQKRPWDVAVKLAGPVIIDMSSEPPGIQVVEATADTRFVDRLREMFPDKYEELALKEALAESEMADLRRRYDAAAGI
ncbi:hypothetical protein MCAG_04609 [Micromonospora sp. ATCC 39149]|uniref:Uncharacterized protein n=1 Tax=Micromonospora carbonacea TaxID=47853 RepID=A0A7D6C420_9ACTN|nr:hypothetical protein [Micromonospora sp. ATCC 39149]EEP70440.1 hypothetical protein MCAG_00767 [Micromonospora sp. ATCC 39149]EEP74282.1 hypothetical protein MCAG_04609 [Micromonospora sp. ATCC 39149]QLJ96844.1 hypothetical protein HZU44_18285 [Micromonospora carbonacea]QLK00119.1 hypothetical protein HZU44_08745 [Micromonospora carbonacea]